MPYIEMKNREPYDELVGRVLAHLQDAKVEDSSKNDWKGQLNYFISRLCHEIIKERGLKYHTCNDLIGVLECIKLELYRMVIASYENGKQAENGPVSSLD